jgi:ribosome biogenesis SPOUT family RNA methylase Rps3
MRRHAIPVVETPFLLDEERVALTELQTDDNVPAEDAFRASGECLCGICGHLYRQHPAARPHHYLTVLCDGTVVKL